MSWVLIIIMGISYGGGSVTQRFHTEEACRRVVEAIKTQVDPTGSKFSKDALDLYGGCYRDEGGQK